MDPVSSHRPPSPHRPLGQVVADGEDDWLGQTPPPSPEPERPAPKAPPASLPNDNWAPPGHELFDGSGQPIFGG